MFISRFSNETVQLVFFRLHLMLHACAVRFVTVVFREKFLNLNKALLPLCLLIFADVTLYLLKKKRVKTQETESKRVFDACTKV
jgi:hypothetical protein